MYITILWKLCRFINQNVYILDCHRRMKRLHQKACKPSDDWLVFNKNFLYICIWVRVYRIFGINMNGNFSNLLFRLFYWIGANIYMKRDFFFLDLNAWWKRFHFFILDMYVTSVSKWFYLNFIYWMEMKKKSLFTFFVSIYSLVKIMCKWNFFYVCPCRWRK